MTTIQRKSSLIINKPMNNNDNINKQISRFQIEEILGFYCRTELYSDVLPYHIVSLIIEYVYIGIMMIISSQIDLIQADVFEQPKASASKLALISVKNYRIIRNMIEILQQNFLQLKWDINLVKYIASSESLCIKKMAYIVFNTYNEKLIQLIIWLWIQLEKHNIANNQDTSILCPHDIHHIIFSISTKYLQNKKNYAIVINVWLLLTAMTKYPHDIHTKQTMVDNDIYKLIKQQILIMQKEDTYEQVYIIESILRVLTNIIMNREPSTNISFILYIFKLLMNKTIILFEQNKNNLIMKKICENAIKISQEFISTLFMKKRYKNKSWNKTKKIIYNNNSQKTGHDIFLKQLMKCKNSQEFAIDILEMISADTTSWCDKVIRKLLSYGFISKFGRIIDEAATSEKHDYLYIYCNLVYCSNDIVCRLFGENEKYNLSAVIIKHLSKQYIEYDNIQRITLQIIENTLKLDNSSIAIQLILFNKCALIEEIGNIIKFVNKNIMIIYQILRIINLIIEIVESHYFVNDVNLLMIMTTFQNQQFGEIISDYLSIFPKEQETFITNILTFLNTGRILKYDP